VTDKVPILSIVIPAYNECKTIDSMLIGVVAALPDVPKDIVIVDDGSTDGTRAILDGWFPGGALVCSALARDAAGALSFVPPIDAKPSVSFKLIKHMKNRGKGGAIRTGLAATTGDVIVIQDADLEYDPQDWSRMYPLIVDKKVADVVYGSRFYGLPHRSLYYHHYLANKLISLIFKVLYDQLLTDVEVCYKMFTREVLNSLRLTLDDFGFEIEISSQIARNRRWRIYETAIHYYGRTYDEGKKINWKDGVKALWYLVKLRF
jgi:glycosyltransferase involved in cell wall biosynthesis